ncbi:hypothetical protein [Seonamhaeicola sp. ML3]|uniref:hypothetical protein n=1 Tax=Seonamhaeicola sp. ML3 TaxID=2937786 RepID=UPI002010A451|nr:hypothetical protein [Seonamhaeicola sp. ML3]
MKKLTNFLKKNVRKVDSYLPRPIFHPWRMSKNEKKTFDELIKKSSYYLEFGSGGSTIRALMKSNTKIYSVDSSSEWIDFMRKYKIIRHFEGKRLDFFHVNIGPTIEWGNPADDSSKSLYPNFSSQVFEKINPEMLDTIFIDGRFRVACILKTIIHLHNSGNYHNKIIMVHDFWNREYYHEVLRYLKIMRKIDTFGVFCLKENLDINDVKEDYNHFKFDIR